MHNHQTHNSSCSSVHRRDGQIRCLHLPHLHHVEPVVGLGAITIAIVRLWCLEDVLLEERSVLLQLFVLKSGADLTRKKSTQNIRITLRLSDTHMAT